MEIDVPKQMKIGVFISIGLIVILGSVFLLGGQDQYFTSKVVLNAHFDHVQGLATGSVVSLSGIKIGNVREINFIAEKNKLEAVMDIDKSFLKRITGGSTVEIRTQGALGDKFIFITPGDPSAPPLKEGDILVASGSTDLMGIISEKGGEAGKIFDIIAELYVMMKSVNKDNRIEVIMKNIGDASASLNKTSQEAQKLMSDLRGGGNNATHLRSTVEKLDRIMTKIDQGEGTLGALINDPSIHDQIKAMLGGSSRKTNLKNLIRTSIDGK